MNLLNRFGLGKGDDEDDNLAKDKTPARGHSTPETGQEATGGYDDSLARLGIPAETVLSDDLLTSGQAKKVRFDYPGNVRSGYSARQVDEFMSAFLVPTLDWHEQALHKRDLDVYRLGQELDHKEVDLQKARFGAQVADSVARVDEDKEFQVLMAQLQEAEEAARILREDNEIVRNQYEELYPQYLELWERYNGELDEESAVEEQPISDLDGDFSETDSNPADDLLALDEPSTTVLPVPVPTTQTPLTVEDIPEHLTEEIVAPYETRLLELQTEHDRLEGVLEENQVRLAQAEAEVAELRAALEEAQNAPAEIPAGYYDEAYVAELTAALEEARNNVAEIPEGYYDEEYVLAITTQYQQLNDQYDELVRRIEAGEYSVPAETFDGDSDDTDEDEVEEAPPVEWAARMDELEGDAVRRNEELALAHAQIADLEAQLRAAREGYSNEPEAEWEEEEVVERPATHNLKPEDLPPGIRPEDL